MYIFHIIANLCSPLRHVVNNVFWVLGWRVDHQTMNWQWYIFGPWLKYGLWLDIWSIPSGTVFGWPYGFVKPMNGNNFALRVTLFVPNSHQGVKRSLRLSLVGHVSCQSNEWQQYDFRLTLNLSGSQIISQHRLWLTIWAANQWMATVWSPADSKLVRESNCLTTQALADHMSCKPLNGNSMISGWL